MWTARSMVIGASNIQIQRSCIPACKPLYTTNKTPSSHAWKHAKNAHVAPIKIKYCSFQSMLASNHKEQIFLSLSLSLAFLMPFLLVVNTLITLQHLISFCKICFLTYSSAHFLLQICNCCLFYGFSETFVNELLSNC